MENKITKVSQQELKNLISEQASKYKRQLELEKQREDVINQLNALDNDSQKNLYGWK